MCRDIDEGVIGGSIPEGIGSLTNLTHFRWYAHKRGFMNIETSLPKSMGALSLLEVFVLEKATVFGTIHPLIGFLVNLRVFEINRHSEIDSSRLTGVLPSSFGNLARLERLALPQTGLDGFSSNGLIKLPKLKELWLKSSSKFSMMIFALLSDSYDLEILDVSSTQVFGPITFLKNLTQLRFLNLANTLVSGTIPVGLWQLRHLESIKLMNGRLTGSIDPDVRFMANLTFLSISNTVIRGTIPAELGSCLKLERLEIASTNMTGTIPPEFGNLSSLKSLSLIGLRLSGTIPASLANLKNLFSLTLSSGLTGTIPKEFENFEKLTVLELTSNLLTGTLPDIRLQINCVVIFTSNSLTGTIPPTMARHCSSLNFQSNKLGPSLPIDIFENNTRRSVSLDLSHNNFQDCLPNPPPNATRFYLQLAYNRFYGDIPPSYCRSVEFFSASSNLLSSDLVNFLGPGCMVKTLYVDRNLLTGTIRPLLNENLVLLDLSFNSFTGPIPRLSRFITVFRANNNQLSGSVPEFWDSVIKGPLKTLNLGTNELVCPKAFHKVLQSSHLESLSIAHNLFDCLIFFDEDDPLEHSIRSLDISHNRFTGFFPPINFPNLVSLNLAHNRFFGILVFSTMPNIATLDISSNEFSFPFSLIASLPYLVDIKADSNNIYGTLQFDDLDALRTANFTQNALSQAPDLVSITNQFSTLNLMVLSVSHNPFPRFPRLDKTYNGFERSQTSRPSNDHPIVCYLLGVPRRSEIQFIFDEDLFSYGQCECDATHFGLPPNNCQACPAEGTAHCGAETFTSLSFTYVYAVDAQGNPYRDSENGESLEPISSSPTSIVPFDSASNATFRIRNGIYLTTEQCIDRNSCQSITVNATELFNASIPLESILSAQCAKGCTGRLCSKCICDIKGTGKCYFPSAGSCLLCKGRLSFGASIGVVIGAILVAILVLSTIFFFVLRSKRTRRLTRWEDLPIWRRFLYRIIYLTSLGNIPILITHMQLLVEVTQFGLYFNSLTRIVNGSVNGFGLSCAFPFLADPMASLLLQLFVPFFIIAIVVTSVGVAELCSRFWARVLIRRLQREKLFLSSGPSLTSISSEIDLTTGFYEEREEDAEKQLLINAMEETSNSGSSRSLASLMSDSSRRLMIKNYVAYPAMALATSLSISILKFFYFGTALAAHEYLFWNNQERTGVSYVLNHPWMNYKEAFPLIMACIPSLILFDLVFPLGYPFLCYKFRKTFDSPEVSIYFGSLFETFDKKRFYWGMIDIIRKLVIATVLRGIPPIDAVGNGLLATILAGTLFAQIMFQPWKRKIENAFDSLSSLLLLIGRNVTLTYYQQLYYQSSTVYSIIEIIFILVSIIVIIWQTIKGRTEYQKRFDHYASKSSKMTARDSKDHQEHEDDASSQQGAWESDDLASDRSMVFSDPDIDNNINTRLNNM